MVFEQKLGQATKQTYLYLLKESRQWLHGQMQQMRFQQILLIF